MTDLKREDEAKGIKKDYDKILEKKWKTAYQCAENYQKMYEQSQQELKRTSWHLSQCQKRAVAYCKELKEANKFKGMSELRRKVKELEAQLQKPSEQAIKKIVCQYFPYPDVCDLSQDEFVENRIMLSQTIHELTHGV